DDDSSYQTNDRDSVCDSCVSSHYTLVCDIDGECMIYVNDDETFYDGRYTRHSNQPRLWFNGDPEDYGYVELCSYYYPPGRLPYAAPEDDCVQDEDGDWIRRADVGDHDLFISDDDTALLIAEWAVVD